MIDPNSCEPEALGACILYPEVAKELTTKLSVNHFIDKKHQNIFKAILKMVQNHEPIDAKLVYFQLQKDGNAKNNSASYLADLVDQVIATDKTVNKYAELLEESLQKRKFNILMSEAGNIYDLNEQIDFIQKGLESLEINNKKLDDELNESKEACYEKIIDDFKNSGEKTITTGFEKIDSHMYFQEGDFNVIQAMSNHGKTKFMLNLMYHFLEKLENTTCVFITYESSAEKIRKNFINTVSYSKDKRPLIESSYDEKLKKWKNEPEYDGKGRTTIDFYNRMLTENRLIILGGQDMGLLETIITHCKEKNPNNSVIIFLDYFQIISDNLKSDGWERIKERAYKLEKIAIDSKSIIFVGSQVNDKRETREGKDLYNAATNVIDIFNHSHDKIADHKELSKKYIDKINNKSTITIKIDKSKGFASNTFEKSFIFNGYSFEEKEENPTEIYPHRITSHQREQIINKSKLTISTNEQ